MGKIKDVFCSAAIYGYIIGCIVLFMIGQYFRDTGSSQLALWFTAGALVLWIPFIYHASFKE